MSFYDLPRFSCPKFASEPPKVCNSGRQTRILSRMPSQRPALFACLLLAAPLLAAGQAPAASKAERIDGLVAQYQRYGYFNGAILVADHGKVIYSKGVGYSNIAAHTPNTPRTRFGIASITKQ